MMKNGIIGSQCYHKYNLRKACVGPVSFVPERVSYSGEAVSSIRRFEKKTLNLQQTEVQVPALHCVTLYKSIHVSEPISVLENGSFARSLCDHMHELSMGMTKQRKPLLI